MLYKIVSKIEKKGYPINQKTYLRAHTRANEEEKKKYPSGYLRMKKIDSKLNKNELSGKNTKTGKIIISKKVPKYLRKEVAFHEKTEHREILRLKKKK